MSRVSGNQFNIEINNGYNPSRFSSINNELAINLFEFDGAMVPTAGFSRILESLGGETQGRGIFYSNTLQRCVAVIGDFLYSFTDTSHQQLGRIDTLEGRVYFAENGLTNRPDPENNVIGGQVAISDGKDVYIYSIDGSLTKARDETGALLDFSPGTISYQNSFFFVNDLASNRIYASELNNAKIFPVLNFDVIGGQTVTCLTFKNLLYVFGSERTNIFYDNAQQFFPYSQDVNRAWDHGCFSASSLASSVGMMAWLGNSRDGNPTVLASNGGTPKSISTPGIDSVIGSLENIQDCDGAFYEEDGHAFYQLNFNSDSLSILYDFTTGKWSRLTDFDGVNAFPVLGMAYFKLKNKLLALTKKTGEVVQFGIRLFNYNNNIVPRTIVTKNYTLNERQYIIKEIDLQIEQGENVDQSRICLSISKDNGRTYPIMRVVELGDVGERKNLLRFLRLGAARWWTFKYDFFSLDRFVILNSTGYIQK